jgi:hypothetical protein
MMWLYVGLVAVVCAAVPATVWLKRAGDRAWQLRRRRPRVENGVLVVNIVADVQRFIRAMEETAKAAERLCVACRPPSRRARARAAIIRLLKGLV